MRAKPPRLSTEYAGRPLLNGNFAIYAVLPKLEEMHSREDKYLLGYIAAAMKNRCFDLWNQYYQKKDGEQLLDDTVTTLQDDPLFEETIELKQFFSFLTKLQKQILIAEYVYGYSDVELSRKLHTARQAVNRTKNRGLNVLRNFYRERGV